MPKFRYVAMDAKGKESEGVLDAASQAEASPSRTGFQPVLPAA